MTKKEFVKAIKKIQQFKEVELRKLDKIVSVLTDKEFNFSAIGYQFVDDYIELLQIAICDNENWVNWFIHDNDFGRKGLQAGYDGKTSLINDASDLYNLINYLSFINTKKSAI